MLNRFAAAFPIAVRLFLAFNVGGILALPLVLPSSVVVMIEEPSCTATLDGAKVCMRAICEPSDDRASGLEGRVVFDRYGETGIEIDVLELSISDTSNRYSTMPDVLVRT